MDAYNPLLYYHMVHYYMPCTSSPGAFLPHLLHVFVYYAMLFIIKELFSSQARRDGALDPMALSLSLSRESIYRLLPQTTIENISKHFEQYSIDPSTRYRNLNTSCIRPNQVSLTTSALVVVVINSNAYSMGHI